MAKADDDRAIQARRSRFLGRRYRFCRHRLGLQLPHYVDHFPFAVELRDFKIIDPIGRDDFHDGGIIVTIENRNLFQLSILQRLFSPAVARVLDESHRAHVIELAAPCFRIGRDHTLGQFGMKRVFHTRGVACVPTFDVIERRLGDRSALIR